MKLAIFGATGRTGRLLLRRALERGHAVKAFTRSPGKLADEMKRQGSLIVVEGDVRDAATVRRAVEGVDAVVSVLGPTENTPDYQVAAGTANIVAAMRDGGVERLIVTSGAGVTIEDDRTGLLHHLITGLLLVFSRHVYEDMRRTVEIVREADLAWTIVRLPMLTDAPLAEEIRVGYVGVGTGPRIGREDVACFLLDELERDEHIRDAPVISR